MKYTMKHSDKKKYNLKPIQAPYSEFPNFPFFTFIFHLSMRKLTDPFSPQLAFLTKTS